MIDEYTPLLMATNLPEWLKWIVLLLIDKRRGYLLQQGRAGGLSVWELWQRTADMAEMRSKWSDTMRDQGVDILVYPAMPLPAFKHGLRYPYF
jgi:hypothetical protein